MATKRTIGMKTQRVIRSTTLEMATALLSVFFTGASRRSRIAEIENYSRGKRKRERRGDNFLVKCAARRR